MDTMTIIYIVVAFVVGAILTSIFKKGSNSTSSDNAKMQELEAENGSLKEKLSSISNESRNKESQLKEKYESLLSEAQKQCDSLDKQLKSAIDGNIDESIKKQLEQVDKLKKQVKDLEEEVEEQEDDISSLKKKLRTKEDDITGLQDSLFKEQSTSKKLNTELEPETEEKATIIYSLCKFAHGTSQLISIHLPVTQTGSVAFTLSEPAIIEDQKIHAQVSCRISKRRELALH